MTTTSAPGQSGAVETLDAHALSVRELTDALLSAFRSGRPALIYAAAWKRPSVDAIANAITITAGARGSWSYTDTKPVVLPPPAALPAATIPEPQEVPLEAAPGTGEGGWSDDLDAFALDPQPVAAPAFDWPLTDELATTQVEVAPEAPVAPAAFGETWLDVSDAQAADTPDESDVVLRDEASDQPAVGTDDQSHLGLPATSAALLDDDFTWGQPQVPAPYAAPRVEPVFEVSAPEPAREPDVEPLDGDALADAAYAHLAFQQPLMLASLRPRPTSSVAIAVGPSSRSSAQDFLRELADLEGL